MKYKFYLTTLSLLVATLAVLLVDRSGSPGAELTKCAYRLDWERHFGDDEFVYSAHAMALSPKDGDILIAGTSNPVGDSGDSGRFWLWKVNQSGEKVREIEINSPHKGRKLNSAYPYISDLVSLENGNVLLVIEFIEGQPSIVRIDNNGKPLFIKTLADLGTDTVISKIVATADKTFLLIGRESDDALAIKIDALGNQFWKRTIDRGKTEVFVDGVATDDGGYILVGNSFETFPGPSSVWIVNSDNKGNVQLEKAFRGRYGSVSRDQEGRYVIVYDKSDSLSQDIQLQALNPDLEEIWRVQVLTVEAGLEKFKINSIPTGGFIVAGSNRSRLWVSRIDNQGKETWNFLDDHARKSWNLNCNALVLTNDKVFILSSVYSENEKQQLNSKVGIIKFIHK